jgi:hypothetical protein
MQVALTRFTGDEKLCFLRVLSPGGYLKATLGAAFFLTGPGLLGKAAGHGGKKRGINFPEPRKAARESVDFHLSIG